MLGGWPLWGRATATTKGVWEFRGAGAYLFLAGAGWAGEGARQDFGFAYGGHLQGA